ncbi:hypothetical protein NDU88_004355 [Pleurodeles waltl]|uniref:Uncharacterized protein n=1 Tax=Pleurodeles waltl TaxID=8319 RepID=A0AAV7TR13_PLEWA|nr:hypothetical protein NDU88_004355 [Pleurodeles waltl]
MREGTRPGLIQVMTGEDVPGLGLGPSPGSPLATAVASALIVLSKPLLGPSALKVARPAGRRSPTPAGNVCFLAPQYEEYGFFNPGDKEAGRVEPHWDLYTHSPVIKGRTGDEDGPGEEPASVEEVGEEGWRLTEAAQRGIQGAKRGPAGESTDHQADEEFPLSAETHKWENTSSNGNAETAREGAH